MATIGRKPKGFTPTWINDLPFEVTGQKVYFDITKKGFGLRVSATTKSFIIQCIIKGRTSASGRPLEIKKSIGRFGKVNGDGFVTLDTALIEYNNILADAEQGITPAERKQMAIEEAEAGRKDKQRLTREEEAKDLTLTQLLDEYLTIRKTIKDSTAALYRDSFKWYFPEWLDSPARNITGDMVLKKHAEIGKRSPAMANSTMKALRAIFNYALDAHEEVFLKNPVRKLTVLQAWYKIDRKENFIQVEDLNVWFQSVMLMENQPTKMLMLFLLFTGARKGEAVNLKWLNFNFKNDSVNIRETKNGKALTIPVAKYVMDELRRYKEDFYTGEDGFVFPSYGKTGHLVNVRRALRKTASISGVKISPHDLRRGVLTYLKNVGVDVFTRKRLVNHAVAEDITEGYTNFVAVNDFFSIGSTGIQTSRDGYVVDFDKSKLIERFEEFCDIGLKDEYFRTHYGLEDGRNWNLKDARRKLRTISERNELIIRCQFRPLDNRWMLYHSSVINPCPGSYHLRG